MRKILILFTTLFLSLTICSCNAEKEEEKEETDSSPALKDAQIIHETKFGGIYVDITIEDFNALGFEYGDSLDIEFSTGDRLCDYPYYDGYYTRNGEILVVAYPGYPYLKIGANNGDDLWNTLKIDDALEEGEEVTVSISLNEKGKYLTEQETFSMIYSNDREKFDSDVMFANFRALKGGDLKENIFYRSASPADNQYNRADYVDPLIKEAGISFIMDLADDEEDIAYYSENYNYDGSYFDSLNQEGNVILLSLEANYRSEAFKHGVIEGFREILEKDGPYLIHCTEGKDRTGFVALIIEALCGAGYEELRDDYMITYDNYYHISMESDPEKYEAIEDLKLQDMLMYLCSLNDDKQLLLMSGDDYKSEVTEYLVEGGMTYEEIDQLIEKLCS